MVDENGKPLKEHALIADLIPSGSKVLDLGCGDGTLLRVLRDQKNVRGRGVDIDQANVTSAIEKGIPVVQGDLDETLSDYQDQSFDYVILNRTIQEVLKPSLVLKEIARIGRNVIVGFPNFAYYKIFMFLLLKGRMPKTKNLPYEWYNTPNIRLLTVKDFKDFCRNESIEISKEIYLKRDRVIRLNPFIKPFINYLVDEAIFVISPKKR